MSSLHPIPILRKYHLSIWSGSLLTPCKERQHAGMPTKDRTAGLSEDGKESRLNNAIGQILYQAFKAMYVLKQT